MTHIMVDLETWGTTPGSDIRSIAAVVFDPIAGTLGDEFYVNVENPEKSASFGSDQRWHSVRMHGLTRDPSTVEWWSRQSEEAQQRLKTDVIDLREGLIAFGSWWNDRDTPATFWAHGPHFDEAILAACYRATGLPVPWHHRAPRDTRTIYEVAGWPELPFEGVEHDALADAKHQARCVIESYRRVQSVRDLLRESGELFRFYERSHRAKVPTLEHRRDTSGSTDLRMACNEAIAAATEKAERNAAIAGRIEEALA